MFRLMRNTHLILGLSLFLFALIFALSSLVIIYRPWLPDSREDTEQTIRIDASKATSPRDLALELMRNHGFAGDLRNVNEENGVMSFRILRPGTHVSFEYTEGSDAVLAETRRWGWTELIVQLHVNHGFHHEFLPATMWSALSLLGSIGLLLLGATGLYLWFCLHEERVVGSAVLTIGLVWGLTALIWARMG